MLEYMAINRLSCNDDKTNILVMKQGNVNETLTFNIGESKIEESDDDDPDFILETVNMVAVAVGVPPNKPLHILAKPWPKVSLLLICLTPVRLSDIIHVNKLSIITKHASEKAGFINSKNLSKFGIYKLNIFELLVFCIFSPINGISRLRK